MKRAYSMCHVVSVYYYAGLALLFKNACFATVALTKIPRCADRDVYFILNCVWFIRFRCALNCTPQGPFRGVMVCYLTRMHQKTVLLLMQDNNNNNNNKIHL